MKPAAMLKVDPSILVSIFATTLVLATPGVARPLIRGVRLLFEVGWLYVTSTGG